MKYDILGCTLVIAVGLVWFAASEVVYDGSGMENPFLRSGWLAQIYVPLAAMYLVKAIRGDGCVVRVVAWMASFLVFWAMIAVDVWVTHFKPDCDICHIPANECFTMFSVGALVLTVLASVSDVLAMRWIRKIASPFARLGFFRRVIRIVGTVMLTWLLVVLTYWALYAIVSTIRLFVN